MDEDEFEDQGDDEIEWDDETTELPVGECEPAPSPPDPSQPVAVIYLPGAPGNQGWSLYQIYRREPAPTAPPRRLGFLR